MRVIYLIWHGNFANEMKTNFTSICWYVCHVRHTGRKLFIKIVETHDRPNQSSDSCNSPSDWRLHTYYYCANGFVRFEHSFRIGLRLIIQEELILLWNVCEWLSVSLCVYRSVSVCVRKWMSCIWVCFSVVTVDFQTKTQFQASEFRIHQKSIQFFFFSLIDNGTFYFDINEESTIWLCGIALRSLFQSDSLNERLNEQVHRLSFVDRLLLLYL